MHGDGGGIGAGQFSGVELGDSGRRRLRRDNYAYLLGRRGGQLHGVRRIGIYGDELHDCGSGRQRRLGVVRGVQRVVRGASIGRWGPLGRCGGTGAGARF
jgi:hypothetical protein